VNSIRKEAGQFLAREQAFQLVNKLIGLFFSPVKINLLLELDKRDQGLHPFITAEVYVIFLGKLKKIMGVRDQFLSPVLESGPAPVQLTGFVGKNKTAQTGQ